MTGRRSLAPVTKTVLLPGRRRGGADVTKHLECWEAETTDGVWLFVRLEGVPGTPWTVEHKPTEYEVGWQSSLLACRRYVANGSAAEDLELLQAHERGEHTAKRVPACGRC